MFSWLLAQMLVGANGAGETTFMKCLAGQSKSNGGIIKIDEDHGVQRQVPNLHVNHRHKAEMVGIVTSHKWHGVILHHAAGHTRQQRSTISHMIPFTEPLTQLVLSMGWL
jgi:ATPase subunit of ABC transporter with duplicated ATPase domains